MKRTQAKTTSDESPSLRKKLARDWFQFLEATEKRRARIDSDRAARESVAVARTCVNLLSALAEFYREQGDAMGEKDESVYIQAHSLADRFWNEADLLQTGAFALEDLVARIERSVPPRGRRKEASR